MIDPDLNARLQQAFDQCDAQGYPLSEEQKQILRSVLHDVRSQTNPLDQLNPAQRQALLSFAQSQPDWKTSLLNDWVQNRDSGVMQFVRDTYGLAWLNTITQADLAEYAEDTLRLKIGDRIEAANTLWEWVQDDDRDWFSCTVISLTESENLQEVCCSIRFENGQEYEIQGVYDWNRPNWRWTKI